MLQSSLEHKDKLFKGITDSQPRTFLRQLFFAILKSGCLLNNQVTKSQSLWGACIPVVQLH